MAPVQVPGDDGTLQPVADQAVPAQLGGGGPQLHPVQGEPFGPGRQGDQHVAHPTAQVAHPVSRVQGGEPGQGQGVPGEPELFRGLEQRQAIHLFLGNHPAPPFQ